MTPGLVQILLPLAMLVQGVEDGPPPAAPARPAPAAVVGVSEVWRFAEWPADVSMMAADAAPPAGPAAAGAWHPQTWDQVRVEQRLRIRIAPRGAGRDMLAAIPAPPMTRRFVERRSVRCLPVAGIAGVQIGGNDRLVLFMRDERLIGANLEQACNARDFYSGFYLEPSRDGMLCAGRDVLHSRSGTNCSLSHLHELVPADDY